VCASPLDTKRTIAPSSKHFAANFAMPDLMASVGIMFLGMDGQPVTTARQVIQQGRISGRSLVPPISSHGSTRFPHEVAFSGGSNNGAGGGHSPHLIKESHMPQTSCITHTVLIIDPDATARTHLASLLTNRFRVIEAATLDEAAQQIVLHHPRIILIEVDLPGDALTFIRQVRQEPTTQDTCIACVTRRVEVRDKV